MEKVKIRKCESIMDGKVHAIELADGRKATAWCDKVDCKTLKLAYDTMSEVEVEITPYKSKAGKEGLNIVKIFPDAQTIYDAKQGNASANGQYQKSVEEERSLKNLEKIPLCPVTVPQLPKPEDFGEADITSINAKSSVKIKKNSKGIGWEIKVVTGEIDLIDDLGRAALKAHKDMCKEFPVETLHVA